MGRLREKIVLVTGGASGLGADQVIACVREGARVVFGDIQDDVGMRLEAQLRAAGGEARFVHLDVSSEANWQVFIDETARRVGTPNVLINNAGIVINRVPIEQRTVEEWDRVMAVNLRSVFLGTKHAIPHMRSAGGGSIVNVSSIAGIGQSQLQEPAYAASKAAVRMLSKVTATH